MKVRLTNIEERLSVFMGESRFRAARKSGIANEKIGPQSNSATDIESMGAEIAFCKAYNLYPDLQLDERPIADATFPNGMTVDVKQTKLANGRLLVRPTKKEKRCDVYVLVTGVLPEYFIVGGYAHDMLFDDANIVDLGYGPTYGVTQDRLWNIDNLIWRFDGGKH